MEITPPLEINQINRGSGARHRLGRGSLGENWVYHTAAIIWTQHGPVAGNERVSSWKIPDARLHTTETETETEMPRGSGFISWFEKPASALPPTSGFRVF